MINSYLLYSCFADVRCPSYEPLSLLNLLCNSLKHSCFCNANTKRTLILNGTLNVCLVMLGQE